jgi:hypothetical protein
MPPTASKKTGVLHISPVFVHGQRSYAVLAITLPSHADSNHSRFHTARHTVLALC